MVDFSILERVIKQRQDILDSIPLKENEMQELKAQENEIQAKIDLLEQEKASVSKKADMLEEEIANIDTEQLKKDIEEANSLIEYFNRPCTCGANNDTNVVEETI